MCGHTRKDRIKNEIIRNKVGIVSIEEKMRETRIRWFDHVRKRLRDAYVKRVDKMEQLVKKKVKINSKRF